MINLEKPQLQMPFQLTQTTIRALISDRALYVPDDIQRQFTCARSHQQGYIQSMLEGIIIPPLTVNRVSYANGIIRYQLLDGLQRMTSIMRFVDNQFPTFTEKEAKRSDPGGKIPIEPGKYFRDLTVGAQNVILNFVLIFLVLQDVDEGRKGVFFRRANNNIRKLTTAEKYASYHSQAITHARKVLHFSFWSENYIGKKDMSQDMQGSLYPIMIEAKGDTHINLAAGAVRDWSAGQQDHLITKDIYEKIEWRFLAIDHLFKGVRFKYAIQVIPMYQAVRFLEEDGIDPFACKEACLLKWFDGLTKNNYGSYYRGASDVFHKIVHVRGQKEFWELKKNREAIRDICKSAIEKKSLIAV